MPNNVRGHYKRQLEQSEGNLDAALSKLAVMATDYRPLHPDIADNIELAAQLIITAQELLARIREGI